MRCSNQHLKEKFLSLSNKYAFVNASKHFLALIFIIMLIFVWGCSRQSNIDKKIYDSCIKEEMGGYFEKGGILLNFKENVSVKEINNLLELIGSEERVQSNAPKILFVDFVFSFLAENETTEAEVMSMAKQIKSDFNFIESYAFISKKYPHRLWWAPNETWYTIRFNFTGPLAKENYWTFRNSLEYPSLEYIYATDDQESDLFFYDTDFLKVPVGEEIEVACKIRAMNSSLVDYVYPAYIPVLE